MSLYSTKPCAQTITKEKEGRTNNEGKWQTSIVIIRRAQFASVMFCICHVKFQGCDTLAYDEETLRECPPWVAHHKVAYMCLDSTSSFFLIMLTVGLRSI